MAVRRPPLEMMQEWLHVCPRLVPRAMVRPYHSAVKSQSSALMIHQAVCAVAATECQGRPICQLTCDFAKTSGDFLLNPTCSDSYVSTFRKPMRICLGRVGIQTTLIQ